MIVRIVTSAVAVALLAACAGGTAAPRLPKRPGPRLMTEFWVDPGTRPRDLLYGIGGKRFVPPPDARYQFEGKDELGFSVSYDVKGPDGVEWSAKIGPEAQTEVVVSRLLWGLGYHQPPLHYLPSWNLVLEDDKIRKESEARFRPKLDQLERDKYWEWEDNPFVGTPPFNGLLVVLLMLNSTDLKNDNNSIYLVKDEIAGAVPDVRRWFVVRDLGASLGETGKLFPRRNWIEGFEKEEFIAGVKDGRIEFAFTGRHRELFEAITGDDLRWAATRLQKLTDEQWRDAFRAANYTDAVRDRYRRKIQQKIEEALEVAATVQATPDV